MPAKPASDFTELLQKILAKEEEPQVLQALGAADNGRLSRLVRECVQALEINLPGMTPVGARPGEDVQRIGWLKNLTAQGCQVLREQLRQPGQPAEARMPGVWVPRQSRAGDPVTQWPEAEHVEVPIFFVAQTENGGQGVNGWLKLWLWPCEGAQLALLPSVPQQFVPSKSCWDKGLDQAQAWLRQRLQAQAGDWRNHALVWEVGVTDFGGISSLQGNSASAVFALAGLWLARGYALQPWRQWLSYLRQEDWRNKVRVTAAILCPANEHENDLAAVGGVEYKSPANWVLNQGGGNHNPPPLRVAQEQTYGEYRDISPAPLKYANTLGLLEALAVSARNLSEPLGALLGSLQPALPDFAPVENGATAGHLPKLEPDWQVPNNEEWRQCIRNAAADNGLPTSLEAFALKRWATLAREQHEGGSVSCLFVNLQVERQHAPQPQVHYSLDTLLAEYEQDSQAPATGIQALMIAGAPGGGKTWLLRRFEQACMERLLWLLDEQGHSRCLDRPLDVPLYVSLSGLPVGVETSEQIVNWFRRRVLGCTGEGDPPESRLKTRMYEPHREPGLRLRIILDGLNEVKVEGTNTRDARVRQVVQVLWEALRPGLPMLLGTRTHHAYRLDHANELGVPFTVANAHLQPWEAGQIEGYLRKRWAKDEYAPLRQKIASWVQRIAGPGTEGQRLREVLSLPLYLRIQCELLEAGVTRLWDSRTQLMSGLLWRNLHREFIQNTSPDRQDGGLLTAQERAIADEFQQKLDTIPPAFPRSGRLLQGLFALAWEMWLAHPDKPADARGTVELPLYDNGQQGRLSVSGVLRQLEWGKQAQLQDSKLTLRAQGLSDDEINNVWIKDWLHMAKELGWLTVDERSQTARFAHQAYGEFLASQQLFWKPRHAGFAQTPQPEDWTEEELNELALQLAPPPLERSCIEELNAQYDELARRWQNVPQELLDAGLARGLRLPKKVVKKLLMRWGWGIDEIRQEIYILNKGGRAIIAEQGEDWVLSLRHYGDWLKTRGELWRCDDGDWSLQPLAWGLMWFYVYKWTGLDPYSRLAGRILEVHWGERQFQELLSNFYTGLPINLLGSLDEIMLLALDGLPDSLPWLQALLQMAWHMTLALEGDNNKNVSDNLKSLRQTGCWALLSRALQQEEGKLDQLYANNPEELAAWKRGVARLLLAVNQSADPDLAVAGLPQAPGSTQIPGITEVAAHDLRYRLQAGDLLGKQGQLGTDAGDHLRYETVNFGAADGKQISGVRLKREHWCVIRPQAQEFGDMGPFLMAHYPVTIGEFDAFKAIGCYNLMGRDQEEDLCWSNLLPACGVCWYEATAYAHWAAATLYADWLPELAEELGAPVLTLRLPTESEWQYAMRGSDALIDGVLASQKKSILPLLFNSKDSGVDGVAPVGSFPASCTASGIYDGLGNVWEWCANFTSGDIYDDPGSIILEFLNNFGCVALNDESRSLCGGGNLSQALRCRVNRRVMLSPKERSSFEIGFRLVIAEPLPVQ